MNGTLVTISQHCLSCDENTRWSSQEMIGTFPSGNISLSTALLCSGSIPSKAVRMLKFWGVQGFTIPTFIMHQRKFLNQAVRNCWEDEYIRVLSKLDDGVQLSGDARCDSMGHCAKYGSYTLHNITDNVIVCTELVVSTEPDTKKSAAMEVLGLSRTLDFLDAALPHLKIELTTDGHTGVAKHVREEWPGKVTHYLDIWHVAKGIKKRLASLAKKTPDVKCWQRSIINHLYWSAVTSNHDGSLIVAKWSSLANHIVNKHEHENELFPRCAHGAITPRRWLHPASEVYDILCRQILQNKVVLKAVSRLSSDGQTSGLEGFHSTVNHFAPKMYHFGYQGMKSRLEMAAIHFNENGGKNQKKTRDGNLSYNIRYPKSHGGQYIVVPVMNNPTYGYVDTVRTEVFQLVRSGQTYEINDDPPSLCSGHARPASKDIAIAEHRAHARFKNTQN
ncbi:uncharacterized protein LOC135494756 [Lineus longissimus]|uniref:uncharacterized protein LOC135494756 n=1 Tax=Lineus longissimus TaxID=88925 RepID=UPI00315D2194